MMDNKYYTPTIEEFHVGFEFQIMNSENAQWGTYTITKSDMLGCTHNEISVIADILQEEYRVKYLDKEDIESLGFESIGSTWYNLKEVPGSLGYFLYVRLQKWGDKIYIKAYRQDPATTDFNNCEYCDKEDLVSGAVIKNKSELKRLMKQLGIYE